MSNTDILALIFWLQLIVPAVLVPRIILCLIGIAQDTDGDKKPMYKRRIINALQFAVISECALTLINLLANYFT